MTAAHRPDRLPHTLPANAAASFADARDNRPVPADDLVHDRAVDLESARHVTDDALTLATANRPAWTDTLSTLDTITCRTVQARQHPILDVIAARRSATPTRPAELPRLLTLAAHLGTVHQTGHDLAGRRWSSRATPSAGGTHSITFLLNTTSPDDRWFVVPDTPSVTDTVTARQVAVPTQAAADLHTTSDACTRAPAPACLYLVADTARLFARYPRGTSLLWRDAGAAAATAHLIAAELDLESAILGCGGQHLSDDTFPAVLVGAVAIGGIEAISD